MWKGVLCLDPTPCNYYYYYCSRRSTPTGNCYMQTRSSYARGGTNEAVRNRRTQTMLDTLLPLAMKPVAAIYTHIKQFSPLIYIYIIMLPAYIYERLPTIGQFLHNQEALPSSLLSLSIVPCYHHNICLHHTGARATCIPTMFRDHGRESHLEVVLMIFVQQSWWDLISPIFLAQQQ